MNVYQNMMACTQCLPLQLYHHIKQDSAQQNITRISCALCSCDMVDQSVFPRRKMMKEACSRATKQNPYPWRFCFSALEHDVLHRFSRGIIGCMRRESLWNRITDGSTFHRIRFGMDPPLIKSHYRWSHL